MSKITIKYVGFTAVDAYPRNPADSMEIARYFAPNNSYVDSAAYVNGYTTADGEVDPEKLARSIYATNVEGLGFLNGLLPMANTTTRAAIWELAIKVAVDAKIAGEANTGVTFDIGSDYQEEFYWRQMAQAMIGAKFDTKFVAADNSPIMITGVPNEYGEDEKFTITWKNYDGSTLGTSVVYVNVTPSYTGETPVKPEDEENTYTFSGWDPELAPAVADATYTAQFTATPKE